MTRNDFAGLMMALVIMAAGLMLAMRAAGVDEEWRDVVATFGVAFILVGVVSRDDR